MRDPTYGYVFGLILSVVAAAAVIVAAWVYLQAMTVRCFMSLGCTDSPLPVLLMMLAGYLLIIAVLTAIASRVFNCRPAVSFLVNVAPLVAFIAVRVLWIEYQDYTRERNVTRGIETAINEAPAIHLGAPYAKMVETVGTGLVLLIYVPFTVDRTIQSQSLYILVSFNDRTSNIRYSAKRECNDSAHVRDFSFNVVDREYAQPPLPLNISGPEIVSKELQPGKQYYLLREVYMGHALCRASDYADFDPKQIMVTLDVAAAKESLANR